MKALIMLAGVVGLLAFSAAPSFAWGGHGYHGGHGHGYGGGYRGGYGYYGGNRGYYGGGYGYRGYGGRGCY